MERTDFHKLFKAPGPVVLPVIHVLDFPQVERNIQIAVGEGAAGVFLINHDFDKERLLPVIREVRETFPALWLGVNFLAVTGRDAFPILGQLETVGCPVDAYWADDARIDEHRAPDGQTEAEEIAAIRTASSWTGLYFGGTAFKKQRLVQPSAYETAARLAAPFMDAVTTSGIATGHKADLNKISGFRTGVGDQALALASGITPDNAESYADVDAFLVATGINIEGDFYNIEPQRLARLVKITRNLGGGTTQ
jgi:hypothetical protein